MNREMSENEQLNNWYEKIYSFENLYKAHRKARLGKRDLAETIIFENNLGENLIKLSDDIREGIYRIDGYYSFMVYDPKKRIIHALHYKDRVVQHCICDEVLSKIIEPKLIYDNAACRLNKGTGFAIKRLTFFMSDFYKNYGCEGFFLRFDIRKFFDNINHGVLKKKLRKAVKDKDVLKLLFYFIDTYYVDDTENGKTGLPLGNQSSQWFALYYLDSLDRLIKEKLKIKYYIRYMDDAVLIFKDKEYLRNCLDVMQEHIENDLKLSFNAKTQIFPMRNGVDFLGFHFYLTETGKVIRKIKTQNKRKIKRRIKKLKDDYLKNDVSNEDYMQIISSYKAHLEQGHTYKLINSLDVSLKKDSSMIKSLCLKRNSGGFLMDAYKKEFIDFMVESKVLKFGDFTLKSGRKSPFFMNAGAYVTGYQLKKLGEYYAKAIHDVYGDDFDVLFGPAYKGIPLSVTTAIAYSELYGKEIRYCSNRKEIKDHGDTGILLGSKLKDGDRVVIIEDVTTSGKSIEETFPIIKAQADVTIVGLIVSLNRMERGLNTEKCALDEIKETYGINTAAIVSMADVTEALYNKEVNGEVIIDDTIKAAIDKYYEEYGAK